MIETAIGVGIWVIIFLVWYAKHYPERLRGIVPPGGFKLRWPGAGKKAPVRVDTATGKNYQALVHTVESICAEDRYMASDAASMVEAVRGILEIEPSSGQIWEAYALDSLETAKITCDDCKVPVDKIVKKTGIRIQCPTCMKWLALKNSKVTIIDPNRPDLEDWEKFH